MQDNQPEVPFPLSPLSAEDKVRIAMAWSDKFHSSEIREKPCAVCGRLTVLSALHTVDRNSLNLDPLNRNGERVALREAPGARPSELHGPILYHDAVRSFAGKTVMDICVPCERGLQRGNLPSHALANGLFVGDMTVPAELRDLTFAEKLVIARRRHNAFMVEVRHGQHKMRANAVAFSQPVGELYSTLPPPRKELDEYLVILFTHPCKPTKDLLGRTPFVIRHNVVLRALDWLKLNSFEYADVEISSANMLTYPVDNFPVNLIYRASDGTLGTESMPVFDKDDEQGTSEGPCPFSIQGVS
ncbi:hypothetical protein OH76DRAFT_1348108, partial [Lentinus brumalis]